MRLPTWTRIALSYALLVLLTGTVLGFVLGREFERREEDTLRSRLADQARAAAYSSYPLFYEGSTLTTTNALANDLAKVFDTRVTLIQLDGTVVGDSEEDPRLMENHATRPEVVQALSNPSRYGSSSRLSATVHQQLLYVAVAVTPPGKPQNIVGVARVAYPTSSIEQARNTLLTTIALVVLLVSVPAAVLGILLPRTISDQLSTLREVAQRFGRGDLQARVPLGSVGEVRDVSQEFNSMAARLSQTIEQRTQERNQVATVFDYMQDGVLITDQQGRIQGMNTAAASLFNTSAEASRGRSLIELTHDHELHMALRSALEQPGERRHLEINVGDQQVVAAITAVPGADSDAATGLLVLQNVTELRHLERVRRDFVTNIGHELRTPLASIKLLAETLNTAIYDDPESAGEFLRRISVEVDGLTQLVRELLELSRIESGQVALNLGPIAVRDLLVQAQDRLSALAQRAGITLRVDAPESLPPAYADPSRVEQVLVNLVHNAIKYTPPGGTVTLRAESCGGSLCVSVADTGVGIPPEDLPRIFERFYKVDKARTSNRDRDGGTGLGLAIAKHIVQAHGGQIWVESALDKGTTFYFTLPVGELKVGKC